MKRLFTLILGVTAFLPFTNTQAQMPCHAMVGYWESWRTSDMSAINSAYNVVQVAFAVPTNSSNMNMVLNVGNPSQFKSQISTLQSRGVKVLISVGGANDPVYMTTTAMKTAFVSSMNAMLETYNFDGMDIDIEGSSMNFDSQWTMDNPSVGQQNWIDATKEIMSHYQSRTGRKMLLTMAPETVYVLGGLSNWQQNNYNGGAFLPIIEGLRDELDLLHVQYYNSGGMFGIDGIEHTQGDADFPIAMTDGIIEGFSMPNGRGKYSGLPASKVAMGFVSCTGGGSGMLSASVMSQALDYVRWGGTSPSSYTLACPGGHPDLGGVMVWSVNTDVGCGNQVVAAFNSSFPNDNSCGVSGTCTSSASEVAKVDFSVFPNPAIETANVVISDDIEGGTLLLIDAAGNVVLSEVVSGNQVSLNLANVANGVYTVKIGGSAQKLTVL